MKREQMRVVGHHKDPVAEHRHAAIDPARRIACQVLRAWAAVVPDFAPAACVQDIGFIYRRHIHHSIDDNRRPLQRAPDAGKREHPFRSEAVYVTCLDLVEWTEAIAAQIAVVCGPGA